MGYRPVGVYRNPICPILPNLSSILKDMDLYQPVGVAYGLDTVRAEFEIRPTPHRASHAEYPLGGIPDGLP